MPSTSPKKKKAATTATTTTTTTADVKDEITSKNQNTNNSKNNKTVKKHKNKKRSGTAALCLLIRTFQIALLLFYVSVFYRGSTGAEIGRAGGLYVMQTGDPWETDILSTYFACAANTTTTAAAAASLCPSSTSTSTTSSASAAAAAAEKEVSLWDVLFPSWIAFSVNVLYPFLNNVYPFGNGLLNASEIDVPRLQPVRAYPSLSAPATGLQKKKKTFIRTLNESIAYMEDPESVCASLQLHTLFSPVRTIVHARKDKKNKNNIKKKPCHFIDYGVAISARKTVFYYDNESAADKDKNNNKNNNKKGKYAGSATFENNDKLYKDNNLLFMIKIMYGIQTLFFCAGAAVCMYLMVDWYRSVSSFFFSRPATASEKDAEKQKKKNENKAHSKLRFVCAFLVLRCRELIGLLQPFLWFCFYTNLTDLRHLTLECIQKTPFSTISRSPFDNAAGAAPPSLRGVPLTATAEGLARGRAFSPEEPELKLDLNEYAFPFYFYFFWFSFGIHQLLLMSGPFSFLFRCGWYCCCGCCNPLSDTDNDSSSSDEEDEHGNEKKRK